MTNKVIELKTAVVGGKRKGCRPGAGGRKPWSGMLNKDELTRPGGILLAMLCGRASEIGQHHTDMAAELGVTYGYIAQLRSGLRKTEHISDQFANACTLYLGVPRMAVLLAASRVKSTGGNGGEDFTGNEKSPTSH